MVQDFLVQVVLSWNAFWGPELSQLCCEVPIALVIIALFMLCSAPASSVKSKD